MRPKITQRSALHAAGYSSLLLLSFSRISDVVVTHASARPTNQQASKFKAVGGPVRHEADVEMRGGTTIPVDI